jgi:hypothetical protein
MSVTVGDSPFIMSVTVGDSPFIMSVTVSDGPFMMCVTVNDRLFKCLSRLWRLVAKISVTSMMNLC